MTAWVGLLKSGDWLVLLLGLAICAASFSLSWRASVAEKAVVRRGGDIVLELSLAHDRRIDIQGALGVTTLVVERRRVRVASDPGSHQYCVRQGWLGRAGEIAICAPNQISVEIQGAKQPYDSLAY